MKRYSFSNKVLSVLLCIALLFGFASAFAVHSFAEAGKYTWRVKVNVGDNFDSTSDDSKRSYLTIKGSENNGTDAAIVVVDQKKIAKNIITDYDDGTDVYLTNILSGGDIGATTSNTTYTTSYFPTYFYMNMYKTGHAGFGNAKFTTYLEVKNSSGSWITLCQDSASKTGGWGDMYNSGTVPSDKMPYAKTLTYTKMPATTIQVPRNNEPPVTTPFEAKIYDQYGMEWYEAPGFAFTDYRAGVTAQNNTVYVTSEANSADGSDSTIQLNAEYNLLRATANITLKNASYTYRFNDQDGAQIAEGTLKYGQSIPQPETPVKPYDATNHYVFTDWSPKMTRITSDVVFNPEYQAVAHTFLTYHSDGNATCTEDGTKTSTCSCGMTKTVKDTGSKLGHSYFEQVTKAPTCTEKGELTYTCIRGDHSYTEDINPTGHSYTSEVVQPTCTEQGYTVYNCSSCGDTYSEDYTDALGHDWDAGTQTLAPTCTEEGETTYNCSRCTETLTEPIAALGHSFKSWTIRSYPTCTENGEKFSKCQTCKEIITQSLPAYGHSWSEWQDDTEPTCETEGYDSRYCLICSEEEHNTIPALGHDMELKLRNPDDGSEGMYYYECSRQGCDKCAACVIDESGNKTEGEICTPEELPEKTLDVPTTTFNDFNRPDGAYNYINRGASLRIDPNAAADEQAIRFCSSMTMPKDAQVIDFGYLYTTENHFQKLSDLVIGHDYVEQVSVMNGKYSKFTTAAGEVRTFNIVINAKKAHWGLNFIARPYIVYTFAGETFTVYDMMYSSRSVNYIAEKVLLSPTESKYVKDYINSKIFAE
ncbi:MAG: hypothetical protein IJI67_04355 [Clostridia bacterium]|nr:hypothetical protein [Clostridia bacterium]